MSCSRMASGIARLPIAIAVAAFAPRAVLAAALVDVRQQGQLASALDRARDLHLMAPARARDPPRADLALLGDELAQRRDVLVVDLLDLVTAVLAGLAPATADAALLVTPANRLAATACLGHQRASPRRALRLPAMKADECTKTSLLLAETQNGISSSPAPPATGAG